jgi:flagellar basal body-associated protein FliL
MGKYKTENRRSEICRPQNITYLRMSFPGAIISGSWGIFLPFVIWAVWVDKPMKGTEPQPSRGMVRVYRLLVIITFILALSLLGGTVYALIFRDFFGPSAAPEQALSPTPPTPNALSNDPQGTTKVFTGIGLLRLSTAPPNPSTVILSIVFRYDPADNAFAEELASRIGDFRDIAARYMASFSTDELRGKTESEVKAALLHRYNAILRLGQITILFFNEYMIID